MSWAIAALRSRTKPRNERLGTFNPAPFRSVRPVRFGRVSRPTPALNVTVSSALSASATANTVPSGPTTRAGSPVKFMGPEGTVLTGGAVTWRVNVVEALDSPSLAVSVRVKLPTLPGVPENVRVTGSKTTPAGRPVTV